MNTASPLTLLVPDLPLMHACTALINANAVALKLRFIPSMKDKLQHLHTTLNAADSVFRRELTTVATTLATIDLDSIDAKQKQVEEAPNLTPERKQQVLETLDAERARFVARVIAPLQSAARLIAQCADDVQQIDLSLQQGQMQEGLEQRVTELTLRDTEIDSSLQTLTEERRALDELMAVFEKYNIADAFKDVLPTGAEMAALMTAPEVAMIQAGIDKAAIALGKISDGIKYADLAGQRDNLRVRQSKLVSESRDALTQIQEINLQLEELGGLASTELSKIEWVQEAVKVCTSFYSFLEAQDRNDIPRLRTDLPQLQTYIDSLAGVTRKL